MRLLFVDIPGKKPPPSRAYAVFAGIVMPIVCVVLDPIVFRGWFGFGPGVLEHWRAASYAIIVTECLALGLTIAGLPRSATAKAVLAGFLLGGAFFALVVGVLLAPLAALGALAVIGLLGFTPLFCAKLYFGAASRVLDAATGLDAGRRLWPLVAAGLLVFVVLLAGVQCSVEHATDRMIERLSSSQKTVVNLALADLERWDWVFSASQIQRAYHRASSAEVQANLLRGIRVIGSGGSGL